MKYTLNTTRCIICRRPTVMLHRADGEWWLATWRDGDIPAKYFPTARAAREFAATKKWRVRRFPECDR